MHTSLSRFRSIPIIKRPRSSVTPRPRWSFSGLIRKTPTLTEASCLRRRIPWYKIIPRFSNLHRNFIRPRPRCLVLYRSKSRTCRMKTVLSRRQLSRLYFCWKLVITGTRILQWSHSLHPKRRSLSKSITRLSFRKHKLRGVFSRPWLFFHWFVMLSHFLRRPKAWCFYA